MNGLSIKCFVKVSIDEDSCPCIGNDVGINNKKLMVGIIWQTPTFLYKPLSIVEVNPDFFFNQNLIYSTGNVRKSGVYQNLQRRQSGLMRNNVAIHLTMAVLAVGRSISVYLAIEISTRSRFEN